MEEVADNLIAGFAGHGIGVLEEGGGQDDEEYLQNGIILDSFKLTKAFGPEEVAFAEDSAPKASCDTQEDEDEVMDWRIRRSVVGLIKRQFACPCGIECFQYHCSPEGAEESTPKDLSRKIGADFLYNADHNKNNDPGRLPRS